MQYFWGPFIPQVDEAVNCLLRPRRRSPMAGWQDPASQSSCACWSLTSAECKGKSERLNCFVYPAVFSRENQLHPNIINYPLLVLLLSLIIQFHGIFKSFGNEHPCCKIIIKNIANRSQIYAKTQISSHYCAANQSAMSNNLLCFLLWHNHSQHSCSRITGISVDYVSRARFGLILLISDDLQVIMVKLRPGLMSGIPQVFWWFAMDLLVQSQNPPFRPHGMVINN